VMWKPDREPTQPGGWPAARIFHRSGGGVCRATEAFAYGSVLHADESSCRFTPAPGSDSG
jgi:hypothetical protein